MIDLPRHVVVAPVFILLVRQNYGHRYWSLPGGVMECGEPIAEGAAPQGTGFALRDHRGRARFTGRVGGGPLAGGCAPRSMPASPR